MSSDRPSWDETWLSFALVIAPRSRCSRAQVGAVIVDTDNNVVSAAYNGPPRGWPFDGPCIEWCPRAQGIGGTDPGYSNCVSAHAEANAIARADYSRMSGSTIYISTSMCIGCAKMIANSGIARVAFIAEEGRDYRNVEDTLEYLTKCGIDWEAFGVPRAFAK